MIFLRSFINMILQYLFKNLSQPIITHAKPVEDCAASPMTPPSVSVTRTRPLWSAT